MIDYDPHGWSAHFFDLRGSMLRQISYRVSLCALVAVVVTGLHAAGVSVAISDKAHMLIGVALGLLLVFRTNASYDRFWEGRKLWGGIVNTTRNLARASSVLMAREPARVDRLVRWTIAFAWASMHHLRGRRELGNGKALLPQEDAARIEAAQHVPLHVAAEITCALRDAREQGLMDANQLVYLDQNVQQLIDLIGGCERIRNTPLPFAYVVHLRRALMAYCLTLPFALLPSFGWGTFFATVAIAYTMFGIEEIGVEIEDPFGVDDNDLPLERICQTIDGNLRALLPSDQRPHVE